MSKIDLCKLIPEPPFGSNLDVYRKKASFNWKQLKLYIEGEESCLQKLRFYAILQENPECFDEETDPLQKNVRLYLKTLKMIPLEESHIKYTKSVFSLVEVLAMVKPATAIKRFLSYEVGAKMFNSMKGTTTFKELMEKMKNVHSCVVVTELGCGSNLQMLQTRATYDIGSQSFILHTPSIEAWKCWSGNLGKTTTHAMVLAQLYTPNGKCHGLHWFFVPIRNPITMKPYPGIKVGHMGQKHGLNDLDNGFVAFTNYRIPRTALINSFADITTDGKYSTSIPEPNKRFALAAKSLNITRLATILLSVICLEKGIIIGVRYAAIRKIFGSSSKDGAISLLEYPLHQTRLMPYLSACFVMRVGFYSFYADYMEHEHALQQNPDKRLEANEKGMHLIIISFKALSTWIAKSGVQEVREACGGHGYLKASGIADLQGTTDSLLTLEGDNNVLQLQVTKILLSAFEYRKRDKKMDIGFGLLEFMGALDQPSHAIKNIQTLFTPQGLLEAYCTLLCNVMLKMGAKIYELTAQGNSLFQAVNKVHSVFGKTIGNAFTEWIVIQRYFRRLSTNPPPSDSLPILTNMGLLFGLWRLQNHLLYLCEAKYIRIGQVADIQNKIAEMCTLIKDDAVALVEIIAPPDEFLNSILGCRDGEMYKRIVGSFLYDGHNLTRPDWWKEMCPQPELSSNL